MNWRRLRTLMRREILATFRDPFTVTILITVPIVALLLFGYVLSTEVQGLALGVLDANGTSASRRVVAELTAKGTFDARSYATRDEINEALVAGSISAAIIIPPDFDRDLRAAASGHERPQIQLIYDGGEAVLAGNAEGFLRGLISATVADLLADETRALQVPGPRRSSRRRRRCVPPASRSSRARCSIRSWTASRSWWPGRSASCSRF